VLRKRFPEWGRDALVEEYAHSGPSQRAARRMLKDGAHLFEGDSRKPLDELRYLSAVFEILKQRRYGHSGTAEHPGPADATWIPLDGGTS
jgi:hypothetical protein